MSVQIRAYDDPADEGQPVVVMVTRGTFDVSRLAGLMASGRCEDTARAGYLARALRRHNGGRAALKLIRDHGGPALLEEMPAEPDGLLDLILRAVSDPGQFVKRQELHEGWAEPEYESLPHWSARAVAAALARHFMILPDTVNRFGIHVTEDGEVGLTCPEGWTSTACLWSHSSGPAQTASLAHTGPAADEAHKNWLLDAERMNAELGERTAVENMLQAQTGGDSDD